MHSTMPAAFLIIGLAFGACSQDPTNSAHISDARDTTTVEGSTADGVTTVFSCPMHPDVTGKKGDTCPQCGMDLEETK